MSKSVDAKAQISSATSSESKYDMMDPAAWKVTACWHCGSTEPGRKCCTLGYEDRWLEKRKIDRRIADIFKEEQPAKSDQANGVQIEIHLPAARSANGHRSLFFSFGPSAVVYSVDRAPIESNSAVLFSIQSSTHSDRDEINSDYRISAGHGIMVMIVEAYETYLKIYHDATKSCGFSIIHHPFTHCEHSKAVLLNDLSHGYEVVYVAGPLDNAVGWNFLGESMSYHMSHISPETKRRIAARLSAPKTSTMPDIKSTTDKIRGESASAATAATSSDKSDRLVAENAKLSMQLDLPPAAIKASKAICRRILHLNLLEDTATAAIAGAAVFLTCLLYSDTSKRRSLADIETVTETACDDIAAAAKRLYDHRTELHIRSSFASERHVRRLEFCTSGIANYINKN